MKFHTLLPGTGIVILGLLTTSCATLIHGTHQKIAIYTVPDSATVFLNGQSTEMVTPCEMKVKRRQPEGLYNKKNEQVFVFKKEGYEELEVKAKSTFNPMIVTNLGLILPGALWDPLDFSDGFNEPGELILSASPFAFGGTAIDLGTGAHLRYGKRIFANLEPLKVHTKSTIQITDSENVSTVGGLAICIGNAKYLYAGTLENAVNDATDMATMLEDLGYTVMLYTNLDQDEMRKAIDDFGNNLKDYKVGLFFYAGHGIQARGDNYLIPVDANIQGESDVEYTCVNAGRVLGRMESAGSVTNIILLDACRNNPFERSWTRSTQGRGLAVMDAPVGSLIGFATSPGSTASDGTGKNGLYTAAILNHIEEPGLTVTELFQKVRRSVRETSGGNQVPWESTSLEGNYYFLKE